MNFSVCRYMTLLFWLVAILNLFIQLPSPAPFVINIVAAILLVAHFLEFVFFQSRIRLMQDSPMKSFINTLLFGLFYWSDPQKRKS